MCIRDSMIIDKATNGRIYCGFNPMGTVTGRFSSQYPNLQQVPARDPELGPMIRSLLYQKKIANGFVLTTLNKSQEY